MRHTKGGCGHNKGGRKQNYWVKDAPLNTQNVAYILHEQTYSAVWADQSSDGLRDRAALTGESGTSQV